MQIPKTVKSAISSSVSIMLTALAIPQIKVDSALAALFKELNGDGALSLADPAPIPRALKVRQVAEILSRSTSSVKRMVKNGKLRGVYGGASGQRLTGISEQSVRNFMSGASTPGRELVQTPSTCLA